VGLDKFKTSWFKNQSLQREVVAQEFLDEYDIITFRDTEEMYVYEDGIYVPYGEQKLREWLKNKLDNRYTKNIGNEMEEYIQLETYLHRSDFGQSTDWLCLDNCQYNVKTGETKPHNPADKYLSKIEVEYVPEAECPMFDEFLAEHVPIGSIQDVWCMFAHAVHRGYPTQSAFLLWGDTATGKSTTLRVLEELIGHENVAAQSVRQIRNYNHAEAALYGKQANIVSEAPKPEEMKEQEFKALTGGDLIHANPKGKDQFEFYNSATMIFATNDMLGQEAFEELPDEYIRRWEPIKYINSVPKSQREDNYYERFTEDDAEMQGILNRTLEALYRMKKRGGVSFDWQELQQLYMELRVEKDVQGDKIDLDLDH
jgi:putative DNA primase/helicase